MRALIIVDVQHDFLPGGALAVADGDKAIPAILAEAESADVIVTTQDWHPAQTPHFDTWPVHCVKRTHGAELHPDIDALATDLRVSKGGGEADGYSGFDGTSLTAWLGEQAPDEVVVVGLALDYCVKATALDAAALGYKVIVPLAATRPVDPATAAAEELRAAGVEIR